MTRVEIEKKATVVTYMAPPNYGRFKNVFPERIKTSEIDKPVDLSEAYGLTKKYEDGVRIYPGSMELRDDEQTYALGSRTVCAVGIGESIESAREKSLVGLRAVKGGALWFRTDIASREHIAKSIDHMKRLRKQW